jgi:hypothetical protein
MGYVERLRVLETVRVMLHSYIQHGIQSTVLFRLQLFRMPVVSRRRRSRNTASLASP